MFAGGRAKITVTPLFTFVNILMTSTCALHFSGNEDLRLLVEMRQRLALELALVQRFAQLVGDHLGHEDRDQVRNDERDVADHLHLKRQLPHSTWR